MFGLFKNINFVGTVGIFILPRPSKISHLFSSLIFATFIEVNFFRHFTKPHWYLLPPFSASFFAQMDRTSSDVLCEWHSTFLPAEGLGFRYHLPDQIFTPVFRDFNAKASADKKLHAEYYNDRRHPSRNVSQESLLDS